MCKQKSVMGLRHLQMFMLSEHIVDIELEVLKHLNA